jgi:coenzyme PQQ precursor peptide PqqA
MLAFAAIGPNTEDRTTEAIMDWTTPTLCEVAVGMEVTSYLSAEV